jgi:putative addiction module component (TIGR02574 family)
MRTKDLIAEATSLPIEERAIVVDLILKSLTPTDSEVDRKWKEIALRRVEEIKSGKVNLVPGNEVFKKTQERFRV